MRKFIVLLSIAFLAIPTIVISQIIPKTDSNTLAEKAKYLKEDLTKFLRNKTNYPMKGFEDKIEGDVVFSIIIRKDGTLDSLTMLNSANLVLAGNAISVLKLIDNKWSPAKVNDISIDKKYLIIFRYRLYIDTEPIDYKRNAVDLVGKQKYEKAIKVYDKAIKENKYDAELFEARSQLKGKIGDIEGAKQDYATSIKLYGDIMSVVNVVGKGVTRKTVIRSVVREVGGRISY